MAPAPSSDPTAVRAALERILGSDVFARSDRLSGFLRFVVERTLAGDAASLKELTIGVEVYGRPDFDPRMESAVRVDARRLRLKLDEYYAGPGVSDPIRIELPKGTYQPQFALALEGPAEVPRPRRRLWLAAGAGVAALAAVVYFAAIRSRPPAASPGRQLTEQAAFLAERHNVDSLTKAVEYARQATERAPSDAAAFAVLADAELALADLTPTPQSATLIGLAQTHAQEAARLNGRLASPLVTQAAIRLYREWRWHEAEDLFRRALALEPGHSKTHVRYSRLLSLRGRHDEARKEAAQAVTTGPVNIQALTAAGQAAYYARDFAGAVRSLGKAIEFDPPNVSARQTMTRAYEFMGQRDDALRMAGQMSPESRQKDEGAALLAWLSARAGKPDAAREHAARMGGAAAISRAAVDAALGDADGAFATLREAVAKHEFSVVYLKVSPSLDPLRRDRRLEQLCGEVGLNGCLLY